MELEEHYWGFLVSIPESTPHCGSQPKKKRLQAEALFVIRPDVSSTYHFFISIVGTKLIHVFTGRRWFIGASSCLAVQDGLSKVSWIPKTKICVCSKTHNRCLILFRHVWHRRRYYWVFVFSSFSWACFAVPYLFKLWFWFWKCIFMVRFLQRENELVGEPKTVT